MENPFHSSLQANLCFVDIDNHCVEAPEDLPLFPDQTELIQELSEVLLHFGLPPQGGAPTQPPTSAPAAGSPRLSSLVLEDLMEDRRNGNLGGEELAVLERLQALAKRCGGGTASEGGKTLGHVFEEEEEELKASKLNIQLREVFAVRFAAMFGRYEEFIVNGATDLDSWMSNREGTCSFDKVTVDDRSNKADFVLLSDKSSDCILSVLGLLPLCSASSPLALLVPVPGDVHVFVLCGW